MTEKLSERLRRTTQAMANAASVNMSLWDRHSNACLEAADALDAQAARIEVLEGALRRIEHEAIIRKSENAAQTVDDLRALARAALGDNHDPR